MFNKILYKKRSRRKIKQIKKILGMRVKVYVNANNTFLYLLPFKAFIISVQQEQKKKYRRKSSKLITSHALWTVIRCIKKFTAISAD